MRDYFEIMFCIAIGVPVFMVVIAGFFQLCFWGLR